MSYILEALKKSQQERDLGRVPTLATQPFFENRPAVANHWGLAATVLASLAVAIALFAALWEEPEVLAPVQALVPPLMTPTTPPAPASATLPQLPAEARTPDSSPAPSVLAKMAMEEETSPDANTDADGEFQPEPVATATAPAPAPVAPEDPIPEDLRSEIEAFKDQLRQDQGGPPAKKVAKAETPPQKRRLPPEVEKRLPAYLLTVHLFDKEPAKRFVVIGGRKLRQGESTRDGILVEEILPDGVTLAFEGHSFFRPR
jgi:general secretion pathway protein B